MGLIFDIKRYAVHDGPGIRTTVFFKGCPLTCVWCHNPEGKSREPEIMWSKERCIQCKSCQDVCNTHAISNTLVLDREKCTLCRKCVEVCPAQALQIVGKEMTVTDVMNEIKKDIIFYDESKGGVTFSGGEPLMQPDFLFQLLRACTNQGIHTAVDTSGYAPLDILLKISAHTDLFLYDIKVINDKMHKKTTGVSNTLILENVKKLPQHKVVVRFPLVPGVNDHERDIKALGAFVSSVHVKEVNILPYHKAGIEKAKRLNHNHNPFMCEPLSSQRVTSVKKELEAYGLTVTIGG